MVHIPIHVYSLYVLNLRDAVVQPISELLVFFMGDLLTGLVLSLPSTMRVVTALGCKQSSTPDATAGVRLGPSGCNVLSMGFTTMVTN